MSTTNAVLLDDDDWEMIIRALEQCMAGADNEATIASDEEREYLLVEAENYERTLTNVRKELGS